MSKMFQKKPKKEKMTAHMYRPSERIAHVVTAQEERWAGGSPEVIGG